MRAKKQLSTSMTVWLCFFSLNAADGQTLVVPLRVAYVHQDAALTGAEADRILAEMTKILRENDGPGDTECDIRLERDGAVREILVGDGAIDSAAEWDEVMRIDANVIVVPDINWCAEPSVSAMGCSPNPGSKILVERDAVFSGILWAHEYGHTRGLHHRDDADVVMRKFTGESHRRINQTENNAYRRSLLAFAARLAGGQNSPEALSEDAKVPVTEFVQRVYAHGVPWDEASSYTGEDVPAVLSILNNPEKKAFHANAIETLALIGDERCVKPVVDYFFKDGEMTLAEYRAKLAALMHFGTLHNKTKSDGPLNHLIRGIREPDYWKETVQWHAPRMDQERRRRDLANMNVWGLALSGSDRAIQELDKLNFNVPYWLEGARITIPQAINAGKQIHGNGLMKYWQESKGRQGELVQPK